MSSMYIFYEQEKWILMWFSLIALRSTEAAWL